MRQNKDAGSRLLSNRSHVAPASKARTIDMARTVERRYAVRVDIRHVEQLSALPLTPIIRPLNINYTVAGL